MTLGANQFLKGGRLALSVGLLSLAAVGFLSQRFIEGLQPAAGGLADHAVLASINAICLAVCGLAVGWQRYERLGGIGITAIFGISLLFFQLPKFAATPISLHVFVAPLECLALAATGSSLAFAASRAAARLLLAIMLLLFAAVHLVHSDLIASLIPQWIPFGTVWPWVTGTTMLLAAMAMLSGWFAKEGALTIAMMFLAWIPLVHVTRIVADAGSWFEWSFAATAIALAGCLLLAAGAADNGETPNARPNDDAM